MGYDILSASDLRTVPAGADLSTHQHKFVNLDTNGRAFLSATAGARCFGVLQNTPDAQGKAATIAVKGVSKVKAEGPISKGNMVVASTAGLAITSSTTAHHRVGRAMEAATLLGDLIAVELVPLGPEVP
ncbi:MAG: DUF2190 family protein [Deltaproteobacteria bacterium]|nr:DUF2190 family protein [Deltaproteobacteria bacterium]